MNCVVSVSIIAIKVGAMSFICDAQDLTIERTVTAVKVKPKYSKISKESNLFITVLQKSYLLHTLYTVRNLEVILKDEDLRCFVYGANGSSGKSWSIN